MGFGDIGRSAFTSQQPEEYTTLGSAQSEELHVETPADGDWLKTRVGVVKYC